MHGSSRSIRTTCCCNAAMHRVSHSSAGLTAETENRLQGGIPCSSALYYSCWINELSAVSSPLHRGTFYLGLETLTPVWLTVSLHDTQRAAAPRGSLSFLTAGCPPVDSSARPRVPSLRRVVARIQTWQVSWNWIPSCPSIYSRLLKTLSVMRAVDDHFLIIVNIETRFSEK